MTDPHDQTDPTDPDNHFRHHDHHDTTEETTTVPYDEPTRFDVHRTNFDEPTAPYKRLPYVSPPRAHTHGAAASTPPADPHEVAGLINRLLDSDTPPADPAPAAPWRARRRPRPPKPSLTLRQAAERREREQLRHQRTLERFEVANAVVRFLILVALLMLVIGAGVVAYGILVGYFTWAPTRTG